MNRKELGKLLSDETECVNLAGVPETGAGKAFLKAITNRRDTERLTLELNPREAREIKNDYRYKLGLIAALNWVLDLPKEVNEVLRKTGR